MNCKVTFVVKAFINKGLVVRLGFHSIDTKYLA